MNIVRVGIVLSCMLADLKDRHERLKKSGSMTPTERDMLLNISGQRILALETVIARLEEEAVKTP